ncbi:MAG: alpha/beta hydrolase [Pseudomonadota bacterium]
MAETLAHFTRANDVETAIGRLAVWRAGAGKQTLVLWPSVFTDHAIFARLVQLLGSRFNFVAIDGPGHGASGAAPSGFTMDECAHAMLDVMNALTLETACMGGVSWGGMVAAHAARLAPTKASHLVLINTPMLIGRSAPSFSTRLMVNAARYFVNKPFFQKGAAGGFFADPNPITNTYMKDYHAMLSAADAKALTLSVRSVMFAQSPVMDVLPHIQQPTLIVAGLEDALYPIKTMEQAADALTNGQLVTVPGKHISTVDAPREVADALDNFLKT